MAENRDLVAEMQNAGLRRTGLRERILATLLESGKALSHPELVGILADADRVSIFRSLKILKSGGLLHSVQGIDGVLRYSANTAQGRDCPGNHPHFLCVRCSAMNCLSGQILPRVEVPSGTLVQGKQYLVYGICPSCAALGPRYRGLQSPSPQAQ